MIDAAQLGKFKRRAKFFQSQEHLDKAMFAFPVEHHEEIAAQIQPLLTKPIIARKVEALELKARDPEAPTLHEDTVQRLNNMAAEIERMKARAETQDETIGKLKEQRDALQGEVAQLTASAEAKDSVL